MKKVITILSVSLFLFFSINTISTIAQTKKFSQGFYTMNDLGLQEGVSYNVKNYDPYVEGLLIIIDNNTKIQQAIRIPANSGENTIVPLKSDYKFIIYNNIQLVFS